MTMTIESLKFVRTVVGFTRAGVLVQPVLIARAAQMLQQMNIVEPPPAGGGEGEGAQPPLGLTQKIVDQVRASIMPSQAACTDAMAEIDAVLVPLRQAQRTAETLARNQSQPDMAAAPAARATERG